MPVPEDPNISIGPTDGKKFAIIVGVNSSNTTSYFSTLEAAERDALNICSALQRSEANFTAPKLLMAEKANTTTILDEINRLITQTTLQDFLLFYFIGHGQPVRNKKGEIDVYIVTHDFNPNNAIQDKYRYISFRRLRELLYEADDTGGVLIILDCCYSGRMITPPDNSGRVEITIDIREIVDNYLDQTIKVQEDRLRVILTSTKHNQQAQERVLTSLLLPALQGEVIEALDPNTGNVDIHSLFMYLKTKMSLGQSPALEGKFAGRCILASYPKKSRKSLEQARKAREEEHLKKLPAEVKEQVAEVLTPFLERTDVSSSQTFDHLLCQQASVADLDSEKISRFFKQEIFLQKKSDLLDVSEEERLIKLVLVKEAHPTYGALLCFGKHSQHWVSSAITRCTRWDGNDCLVNSFYEGDLLSQYEGCRDFLRTHLHSTQVISREGSTNQYEIPFRVLEEAITNALVHRDYKQQNSFVQVQIFQDRVEISSPGESPLIPMDVLGEDTVSHPRNFQIASIFYLYGLIQEAGSGIPRMRRFMEEAGLPPPEFKVSPSKMFKVVLYRPKEKQQATDRVGQLLGADYRLTRFLSKSGFAEVYLAEQLSTQSQVVVKILQSQLSSKEHKNFLDEAFALSSLVHPNIVRILAFFIQDNIAILIMDYAPNGSLRTHHSLNQPLSPVIVISYVKQIASALQYAHNQDRLHLNIKPANMLVGPRGEVMLTDFHFSLEAQTEPLSLEGIVGTATYMAPEQFHGESSAASDQYALGVVVYEWLTGTRPFEGSSTAVAMQHLNMPPPSMKVIPAPIEQVVMKALAKEPKDRFENVLEFAKELEQAYQSTLSKETHQESTLPSSLEASKQPTSPWLSETEQPLLLRPTDRSVNPSAGVPNVVQSPLSRTSSLRRSNLFEIDPGYLRVQNYNLFRTTGIALNLLSSFMLGFWQQSWIVGVGSIVLSIVLFLLCILLVRRSLALSLSIVLALYWGVVGWASASVTLSVLHVDWLPAATSLLFFLISLYLHVIYVRDKDLL